MNKLKVKLIWDNGKVSNFGNLDYDTFMMLRSLADEVFAGNAVEIHLNDDMASGYPEKHSGEHLMASDVAKLTDKSKHTKKAHR